MTPSNLAIEASGLVKTFGDVRAVDGVDLAVPRGSVYGVLGPNGAGKTTAVRILTTLLDADGGTAEVAGFDVRTEPGKVRASIEILTGKSTPLHLKMLELQQTVEKVSADFMRLEMTTANVIAQSHIHQNGPQRSSLRQII